MALLRSRRPSASGVALVALLGTAGWGLSSSPPSAAETQDVSTQVSAPTRAPEFTEGRIVDLQEIEQAEAERVILADRATAARAARDAARKAIIAHAKTDPQSAARAMLGDFGWNARQMPCLVTLWHGESAWHWNADNRSSSAYGIPQALPGSKMASAGADWRTNPVTQIRWGMAYITRVYGSPCSALSRWSSRYPHWY
ncbi:MAG TPA: hypothetical protein VHM65_05215 [Candidatus Lustribacter sp.]|nr:hypothetical protein [Candidatus Lustribacter sp.]